MKNTPILTDLYSCDRGLSPTDWQRQQFPSEYHSKISVLHDGVDTEFFKPKPGARLVLPRLQLDLSHVEELVTYVGRGMEPYRGFPQFIEAASILQQRRPNCHVVIVGSDRVAYGKPRPDGKSYKEAMLEQFPLDLSRTHFTGHLPYEEYLQVLQASSAHVYLTRPFVLSWSMIESMSAGCLLVASNTAPVREVIQDGVNGLLADFFSPSEIADRLEEALTQRDRMAELRAKARETALTRYDLTKLLPQHLQWIQQGIEGPLLFSVPSMPCQPATAMQSPQAPPTPQPAAIAATASRADGTDSNSGVENSGVEGAIAAASALQVGNRTVTAAELPPLLSQYQLLPKLWQESLIDEAIESFTCTPEEEEQCCQEFYAQQQLTSTGDRQTWLQQQGFTEAHLIKLATRKLRIEKFKQTMWGDKLESYFLKCKHKLDQVVCSLIRVREGDVAQELFTRLQADDQQFADLARQYSQGTEAQTGGSIGPVPLFKPHPQLAQLLRASQPGQISPPTQIGEWWIIVRLEKTISAQLDASIRQRLLDERFVIWLQEQRQSSAAIEVQKSVRREPSTLTMAQKSTKGKASRKVGFASKTRR